MNTNCKVMSPFLQEAPLDRSGNIIIVMPRTWFSRSIRVSTSQRNTSSYTRWEWDISFRLMFIILELFDSAALLPSN